MASNIKRKKIAKALEKKGFEEYSDKKDHHYFVFLNEGKKTAVFTKISKGSSYKDIGPKLIGLMSRQLKISKSDFINLIECPLTYDDYKKKLKVKKIIL